MKTGIVAAILSTCAFAAQAQEWNYQAPDPNTDGSPFFFAYINRAGHPDSGQGNDLTLIRDPYNADLRPSGLCSFSNCTFKVSLNGRYPTDGDEISVVFSNGYRMDWQHSAGVVFLDNYATYSMGATNKFDANIRSSEWVEISYSGLSHRFSLIGSNAAMNAIIPLLQGN
jgi:hypothetical protein